VGNIFEVLDFGIMLLILWCNIWLFVCGCVSVCVCVCICMYSSWYFVESLLSRFFWCVKLQLRICCDHWSGFCVYWIGKCIPFVSKLHTTYDLWGDRVHLLAFWTLELGGCVLSPSCFCCFIPQERASIIHLVKRNWT
jgi:hypothetical protein